MTNRFWKLCRDDEAATAVEYAVMLALVLVVVMGAIGTFGAESGGLWQGIDQDLQDTKFGELGGR